VVVQKAPDPAPAPDPEPIADKLVTVSFKTRPAGASVLEGDTVIGKTPLERKWTIDEEHALSFELPGYVPVKRTFRIAQNEGFEIELSATKKPATATTSKKKKDEGIEAFE
jgi:eukaryotic-like serine/threonine-protein kinase